MTLRIALHRNSSLLLLTLIFLFAGTTVSFAQQESTGETKTATVIAGKEYENPPGGQAWLLGKDYRQLWATPIEVPVLDLEDFAGGLTPVMRVGGLQSKILAMKGNDGRDYSFKAVNKNVTKAMPEAFRKSGVEQISQDQISSDIPGVEVVLPPLSEAAGILQPEVSIFVMPDDPALGEFREDFAGILGIMTEYPQPGYAGSTEILAAMEFWSKRKEGPKNEADARAFLRVRLFDVFIGDWDRHRLQWRWARVPGKEGLQPIAEDRDQTFSNYDGFVLDLARMNGAQMTKFEEKYPPIGRSTMNGWRLDRFLLTEFERGEWMEIANSVQSSLTDEVIAEAIGQLPNEYYQLQGSQLESILKKRRDGLSQQAEIYYHHLAREVDVQCSNMEETVFVERYQDGDVSVRVALADTSGPVSGEYFCRRFKPQETKEIRIYLHEGDDLVRTLGVKKSPIKVRVIAGSQNDKVVDADGGKVEFYGFDPDKGFLGIDEVALDPFQEPLADMAEAIPWVPPQDWGGRITPLIIVGYHSDPGLILGAGLDTQKYGFRKYPYANRHILQGGFGLKAKKPFIDYSGDFRREDSLLHFALKARLSGLDNLKYYGLGNETQDDLPDDAYKISNFQSVLFPGLEISRGLKGRFMAGPVVKYSDSSGTDPDTVLGQEQPYGFGKFGQLGFLGRFQYDTRDPMDVFDGGIQVKLTGSYFTELWDVDKPYGSLEGEFGGHIPLANPLLLSMYVGGKANLGTYPFFEAAYIGGRYTVNGYNWNRFGGDSSLYGRLELRWAFKEIRSLVPGELGLTGGLNAGRVWLEGEDSGKWHPAFGAGLFYAPFSRLLLYEFGFGKSKDKTFWIFRAEMRFMEF